MVTEALVAHRWVADIRGAISVQVLTEYVLLQDLGRFLAAAE